jgi:hypothetical protein
MQLRFSRECELERYKFSRDFLTISVFTTHQQLWLNMGLTSILIAQILFLGAANSAVVRRWPSSVSPTGPTDASVAKNCGYWVNDVAENDQCADLEGYFDISREELVNWVSAGPDMCQSTILTASLRTLLSRRTVDLRVAIPTVLLHQI